MTCREQEEHHHQHLQDSFMFDMLYLLSEFWFMLKYMPTACFLFEK